MADGIQFERRGVPAAVVCTDAFSSSAGAMARLQGLPEYRYVVTEHPLSSLAPAQGGERAARILPEVVAVLSGRR